MSTLDRRRLHQLAAIAAAGVLVFLVISLGPAWFLAMVPGWIRRRMMLWLLWGMLVGYVVAAAASPLLIFGSIWKLRRARREPATLRPLFAALAIGLAIVLGLGLAEAGATWYRHWAWQLEKLPEHFPKSDAPPADDPIYVHDGLGPVDGEPAERGSDPEAEAEAEPEAEAERNVAVESAAEAPAKTSARTPAPAAARILSLVVIGESSALGEPYDPDLSVGRIVAWQLEQALPGRRVELVVKAMPGITLEWAIGTLQQIERRPNAILVYSGHNEFQCRFSWAREVLHYRNDLLLENWSLLGTLRRWSSVLLLIDAEIERHRVSFPPPQEITRRLVDGPTCTPGEAAGIAANFRRRLAGLAEYADRIGATLIAVIPPGNDAGDPPCRSVMDPSATPEQRAAFAEAFLDARRLESTDPDAALDRYRALIADQPSFAEAHYRLGVLLRARHQFAEADAAFIRARDLDGLPMRCPSPIQDVYREVAAKYPSMILVDGPKLLRALHPDGLVGDDLIHDLQHPTLTAYAAIARDILRQWKDRRLEGWPEATPAPEVDPAECAEQFGIVGTRWVKVCRRIASFYQRTAHIRYDPTPALRKQARFEAAAEAIAAGTPPEALGLPGIGLLPIGPNSPRFVLSPDDPVTAETFAP